MHRAATTFAMLALLAMIVVPVAAADKPTREFVPAPSEFTLDASICGFDVLVEVLTNKEYAITFSNGMTTVVGPLSVRLTNLDDPTQSIVLNIPGPGFFDESGGLTAVGTVVELVLPRGSRAGLRCLPRLHRRESADRRDRVPRARRATARPLRGTSGSIKGRKRGRKRAGRPRRASPPTARSAACNRVAAGEFVFSVPGREDISAQCVVRASPVAARL